jgi:site-specific DNA recombinase
MPFKKYFSYVRVSTQRQGERGTSLAEQLAAIERYAARWNLRLVKQYEEQETAARAGRPVFLEMLKALKAGRADGVVIHKIDRSARNLKDWADLGALIDAGIEVHFANEAIDLNSRGGRLSADIQAVVASDYIRNLRDEVKKGFYGRLKQGLYPMPAPAGYVDRGPGKIKELHPLYARLVKEAFEMYATGTYSLHALAEKMFETGLRNRTGNRFSKNGIHKLLRNKFYVGLIEIEKTGEIFVGQHAPVVSQTLFDRVQDGLAGKKIGKKRRHFFLFRRLIVCNGCSYRLIGERQKGFVYYRCQTRRCAQKTLREELIEKEFVSILQRLQFSDEENRYLAEILKRELKDAASFVETRSRALELQSNQCRQRLSKLTDAFVDGVLEQELFVEKKNSLVLEEQRLKEELNKIKGSNEGVALELTREILERANRAYSSYKDALAPEKREMVEILTSNACAKAKNVLFKLNYPFEIIVNRSKTTHGGAYRDASRTDYAKLSEIVKNLWEYLIVTDQYQK